MKQLRLLLVVLAVAAGCFGAKAEKWSLRADAVAICTYNDYYHQWNNWSQWERCDVLVTINGDNDKITIYSAEVQVYKIYDYRPARYDSDGDYRLEFKFRDQDGDYGTLYILKKTSGRTELYVVFNNVQWVYNVYY